MKVTCGLEGTLVKTIVERASIEVLQHRLWMSSGVSTCLCCSSRKVDALEASETRFVVASRKSATSLPEGVSS